MESEGSPLGCNAVDLRRHCFGKFSRSVDEKVRMVANIARTGSQWYKVYAGSVLGS